MRCFLFQYNGCRPCFFNAVIDYKISVDGDVVFFRVLKLNQVINWFLGMIFLRGWSCNFIEHCDVLVSVGGVIGRRCAFIVLSYHRDDFGWLLGEEGHREDP